MATDARTHTVPAASGKPERADFDRLSLSINDVIPVANATDRGIKAAALSTAGTPVSQTRPMYVHRADAGPGKELEYSTDGTNFYRVRQVRSLLGTGTSSTITVANTGADVEILSTTVAAEYAGQSLEVIYESQAQASANAAGFVWVTLNGVQIGGKRRISNLTTANAPLLITKIAHGTATAGTNTIKVWASADAGGVTTFYYNNTAEIWGS